MSTKFGLFVVGEFLGVEGDDRYPQIHIRVGEPSERSPRGFVERLDFAPFDAITGKKVLPDALKAGDTVQVRVTAQVRLYVKDGETKGLVAKLAREVSVVASSSSVAA
jgi:hypothetical protein